MQIYSSNTIKSNYIDYSYVLNHQTYCIKSLHDKITEKLIHPLEKSRWSIAYNGVNLQSKLNVNIKNYHSLTYMINNVLDWLT